jgi:hypothetical protein
MVATIRQPLHRLALAADCLLRPPAPATLPGALPGAHLGTGEMVHADIALRHLVACVVLGGFIYGAAMGSFPGPNGPRPLQMLYSGLKVPMLQGVSFALVLPCFFVVNTLLGLRGDMVPALRALLSAQAVMSIVLAALAPLVTVWYLSTRDYHWATLFNGAMFAVAVGAAEAPLRRFYGPLIRRHPRHKVMLTGWVIVYVFVAIQMSWVLRPYIGDPQRDTTFFRAGAWGNAYVVVADLIWRALTH